MRRVIDIIAPRNLALALFAVAAVLVIASILLSILPPPPTKANTGALIWLGWAVLIALFGLALRSGRRAVSIVAAVIAIPTAIVNLPYDLSGTTWVDTVANGLASLVALAALLAIASVVVALWRTRRRATRVSPTS